MRWFLKLSLGILTGFVLFAAILAVLIDPDDLKPPLYTVVREHTGLDLNIEGPLEISFLPRPEIILNRVRISDPGQPENPPLLEAGYVGVGLSSWPLGADGYDLGDVSVQDVHMDFSSLARTFRALGNGLKNSQETPLPAVFPPLPCTDTVHLPLDILHIHTLRVTNATLTGFPALFDTPSAPPPLTVDHLSIDGLGQNIPGTLHCSLTRDNLDVNMNGTLTLSRDLRALLVEDLHARLVAVDLPFLPQPVTTSLSGTLLLEPHCDRVVLRAVRAELPGIDILTSSTITWNQPSWEGGLIVNARLPETLHSLGLGNKARGHHPRQIDLNTHCSLHPDTLVIKDLHTLIDGQALHGRGKITGFTHPKITFKAFGDRLDLTDYLSESPPSDPPNPLIFWFKSSRIRGSFSANRIAWAGLAAENVSTLIRANKGILRIYPLRGRIAEGNMEANIRVDLNPRTPATTFRADLTNTKVRELTETQPPSSGLIGSMDIFMDLAWQGVPWLPDPATLDGQATIEASNGSLVGLELPCEAPSSCLTERTPLPTDIIPFSTLSARFHLHNGVMDGRSLHLTSGSTTISGTGTYDLVENELRGFLSVTDTSPVTRTMEVGGTLNQPTARFFPAEQLPPASPEPNPSPPATDTQRAPEPEP
ncbi:AsmA family protein [Desulfoplanes sp.]